MLLSKFIVISALILYKTDFTIKKQKTKAFGLTANRNLSTPLTRLKKETRFGSTLKTWTVMETILSFAAFAMVLILDIFIKEKKRWFQRFFL
ncbi:hypothetical protein [Priestia megaterium]|uniref:hypothetical protein n=2 Tax=Priestia megaterium TaxID=1404 RepID=UPI003009AA1B